jgi:tetratricopeptide (TPR) repeat protein
MKLLKVLNKSLLFLALLGMSAGAQNTTLEKYARSLERSGDYEKAAELFLKIYHSGNQSANIIFAIRNNLVQSRHHKRLLTFYQELVLANPNDLLYKIHLGEALYLNNRNNEANAQWRKVLESKPRNITFYRHLANIYINFRLFEEAISVYLSAQKNIPQQNILYRDIANLYKALLQYDNAARYYLKYYAAYPKQFSYIKSNFIQMAKDSASVIPLLTELKTIESLNKNDINIQKILASLEIKNKNFAAAYDIHLKIYQKNKDVFSLFLFASECEKNNAWPFAIKAYQKMINAPKDKSILSRALLREANARFYYSQKLDKPNAEKEIVTALNLLNRLMGVKQSNHFVFSAVKLKAKIHRNFYRDIDNAQKIYENALNQSFSVQQKDELQLLLAKLYMEKGNLAAGVALFNEIKSRKFKSEAAFLLAEISLFQGRINKAKQKYTQLLTNLDLRNSLTNDVLDRITMIETFAEDSVCFVQFTKALYLEHQKKHSAAAAIYQSLPCPNTQLYLFAHYQSAQLYYAMGNLSAGAEILEKLKSNEGFEHQDKAIMLLAKMKQDQSRLSEAMALYREIVIHHPSSFFHSEARTLARNLQRQLEKKQND